MLIVALDEQFGPHGLRPDPDTVDHQNRVGTGQADHDRRNTGDIDELALQDANRQPCGDARIDRVAARVQDFEPRLRCKIVTGGNRVPGSHDNRAVGVHRMILRADPIRTV